MGVVLIIPGGVGYCGGEDGEEGKMLEDGTEAD